jgi:hypothetical protein
LGLAERDNLVKRAEATVSEVMDQVKPEDACAVDQECVTSGRQRGDGHTERPVEPTQGIRQKDCARFQLAVHPPSVQRPGTRTDNEQGCVDLSEDVGLMIQEAGFHEPQVRQETQGDPPACKAPRIKIGEFSFDQSRYPEMEHRGADVFHGTLRSLRTGLSLSGVAPLDSREAVFRLLARDHPQLAHFQPIERL